MGNSCVFSCCHNRVNVVDNNINNNSLIKTKNFDMFLYNPLILGNGSSGNTYKIIMNNHKITCKKVTKKHFDTAYEEIKILKEINQDEYLPVFFKAIETEKSLYIMYEYLDGCDLLQMIRDPTFSIKEKNTIAVITKEITLGLYSLFRYNYVHLDIKFENIIISKTKPIKIKIIDLAFCKKLDQKNHLSEICGTHGYISPEVLLYKRYFHNTDVWSLGVVLYGLFTDQLLFENVTKNQAGRNQINNFRNIYEHSLQIKKIDDDAVDLIDKMLQKNPASRISIKDILKHKFIQDNT